jgi:hypothetical protein
MSEGLDMIAALKGHVLSCMRGDNDCQPEARGLGNIEIEHLCDLALALESQDHYLTYSVLHALIADGLVEKVRWPDAPRNPKYRLGKQAG